MFAEVGDDPKVGGWRFFLWWMLTFLGFPLGGVSAITGLAMLLVLRGRTR